MGMKWVQDDGGRAAAGYQGSAGDCVCRSISIVTGRPYAEVYSRLASETGNQRGGKSGRKARSAARGISVGRKWFRDYMAEIGLRFVPLMQIGSGCTAHLNAGEPWIPPGRVIVSVSKHYTALVDGVIHDTHDPSRAGTRCVYGYWTPEGGPQPAPATRQRSKQKPRRRAAEEWRPGMDVSKASVSELVAEVARLTGEVVPRLSIQAAAAMLAEIDTAILETPPWADAWRERQEHYGPMVGVDLIARRMRQLELWNE
jgi:hypothetical protein